MTIFITGLIIFFGVHLIPMTPLKPALHKALGRNPYMGLFSLISLAGLGIAIYGFSMLRSGPAAFPIYWPDPWTRPVTSGLVFVAFICIVAAYTKGHLKKLLKHPMSIGMVFFSIGHLLSNGRMPAVIMFSCFLAYALLDILVGIMKGQAPAHEPKLSGDIIAVVGGVAAFAFFGWFHQYMIGIPLF